jgi:mannosyltransferase OCH1-like enzyme
MNNIVFKMNNKINKNNKFSKPTIYKLKSVIKEKNKSIIPLNLYTCWHTKDLPPKMKQNYEKLKNENPEFNHYLYDENECIEFIKNNFDEDVLNAYNSLIPHSYKSDLWRFCVLYINGGVYLDIKFKCINGFKFISLTEKEIFPTDISCPPYDNEPNKSVSTGFMISLPKNESLLKAIQQIVENVKNRYYGKSSLDPTGPVLLGDFFSYEDKVNSTVRRYVGEQGSGFSIQGILILDEYKEYREDQKQGQMHYYDYWINKNIYY